MSYSNLNDLGSASRVSLEPGIWGQGCGTVSDLNRVSPTGWGGVVKWLARAPKPLGLVTIAR